MKHITVATPSIRFKRYIDPWKQCKLGNIVTKVTRTDETSNAPVMMITAENGFIKQSDRYTYNNSGKSLKKYIILKQGELAYNHGASKLRPYGSCFPLITEKEARIPFVYHCFVANRDNARFLSYILNGESVERQLKRIVSSGARMDGLLNISFNEYKSVLLNLPSNNEENEIANYLDRIDRLITLHQRKLDQLKKLKKYFLQNLFPAKGEKVPRIRFKGFTGDWEQRKLGDICGVYDGIHQTPDYQEDGVMFLSVENIATLTSEKYISEDAYNRNYKAYPEKGDILMTRIGDVGTPHVVETNEKLAYYVSLALLKPKGIDSYFLNNAIQTSPFQKGLLERTLLTAIPMKINKDEIGKVDISFPVNISEQKQIGSYFRNLDNLITLHQRKLNQLQTMKKFMLQNLFI